MTSDEPDMKPLPGVHRPGNSSMWHFQKKVPKDLLDHPAYRRNQWAFRASLETPSLREANAKAATKLAELESLWATYRQAMCVTRPEGVPAALVEAIAQRLRFQVLAEDDSLRNDPGALAASLSRWWQAREHDRKVAHLVEYGAAFEGPPRRERANDAPPPRFIPVAPPRWLTPHGQQEAADYAKAGWPEVPLNELLPLLHQRHQEAAQEARLAFGRGQHGAYLLRAQSAAMALGVNLGDEGWNSPEARPIREACRRAYQEALEALAQRDSGQVVDTPAPPVVAPPGAPEGAQRHPEVLTLGQVVASVLEEHPGNGFKRKMETATRLLLAVIDPSTPVTSLKQAQINDFLAKVCRLPADWYGQLNRGKTLVQLLQGEHPECISPTTYESTYRAGIGAFLKRAAHAFGDQGFPRGLGVEFTTYKGTRKAKEQQQRNFKPEELRALFGSGQYRELASDPSSAHKYWFPLLSLYTGARPRELCQINPQADIGERDGVPFLLISERTPADDKVVKTVKTGEARHVPVHPALISLGFLGYLEKVKKEGARRLFVSVRSRPFLPAGDRTARA